MLLQDKIAVITGGGRGIGRAIAQTFAREGAHLVLAARDVAALEETRALLAEYRRDVLVVQIDLLKEESVQTMAEQTLAHFGRVDILVNNSGITGPTAPLWEIAPAQWRETLDIDLTGPYLCCHALLPSMLEQRSGSIVMIGSITGKRPLFGRSPYAAAKLGLVGLTRTLAWEVGPYNIRVNLISPGPVEGERIGRVLREMASSQHIGVEDARRLFLRDSPLARMTPPADIASAALFLASDLSGSTTGEDFNVSGGIVMY
ncbi:MAG TPA: SDR family NAD(P)-dependent oxidoreductase [Ktedonobacteraceae bacterium]|nr:SDR family NAD(P)-dependent oxidoreductase [Ktedonobacteraceae bacterium]